MGPAGQRADTEWPSTTSSGHLWKPAALLPATTPTHLLPHGRSSGLDRGLRPARTALLRNSEKCVDGPVPVCRSRKVQYFVGFGNSSKTYSVAAALLPVQLNFTNSAHMVRSRASPRLRYHTINNPLSTKATLSIKVLEL